MPLAHTVEEIKLKNGARGLLIATPGATAVRFEVNFRAGNHYARTPEISQVAHIMEHMAFGPNEKYSSLESFSQEFTRNGAYNNAWTGSTSLNYESTFPLMEWRRIIDLQELSITKPVYTAEVLESEKGNVREELTGYHDNNYRVLWQEIMRKAGLDTWYDPDELKSVDGVTLDDIREHYARTHATNNMRFVITGDLADKKAELVEALESWQLPAGELFPVKQQQPASTGPVYVYKKDSVNLIFQLSLFIPRVLSPAELRAMGALQYILTGSFHSRILGAARKRGICYGMGSGASIDAGGYSEFQVNGQVSPKNAPELCRLIIEQLQDVAQNGVTEEELQGAKDNRMGALQLGQDTVNALSGWYTYQYYDFDIIDRLKDMPARIAGTTQQEIKDLVTEFLESGVWSYGGIGNISKEELKKQYDLFAAVLE